MPELSPQQIHVLERLIAAGFRPIAIAPYENVLCVRRGDCGAVLAPGPGGGLRLQAPPAWLIEGNLGVRIRRSGRDLFVWKKKEVDATPERNAELSRFADDLSELLQSAPCQ
jgi:hypothetical protein